MAYCDECDSYYCDGRYHTYFDCTECDAEGSVEVFPNVNPETGDEWQCGTCGTSGEA